jgi:hypothetical protein
LLIIFGHKEPTKFGEPFGGKQQIDVGRGPAMAVGKDRQAAGNGVGDVGLGQFFHDPAQGLVNPVAALKKHGNFLEPFPDAERFAAVPDPSFFDLQVCHTFVLAFN